MKLGDNIGKDLTKHFQFDLPYVSSMPVQNWLGISEEAVH